MSDSLHNICMNFVVEHMHMVDNFVGFPALIGEQLYRKYVHQAPVYPVTRGKTKLFQNCIEKFAVAYESLILEKLNLSSDLFLLNEHLESLIIISRFVTELCVCHCSLGTNHEIYSLLCELKCLKHLCLKSNRMTDQSMKILTLPLRMWKTGGREIEYFNIADNNFTDNIIPYLSAFPKLNLLDISGSNISENGVKALSTLYHLHLTLKIGEHKYITNEGWAVALINKWKKNPVYKYQAWHIWKEDYSVEKCTSIPSGTPLVFQKSSFVETPGEPPLKKVKLSSKCDTKKIEEDIFSQYK